MNEIKADTVSFSIPAEAVQRAIDTGSPVIIDHPEALALAAAGARGIPTKRVTPTTVGILGGETNVEINPRLTQYDWFGSYGQLGYRDRMPREWDTAQSIRNEWTLAVMERDWQIMPVKGGDRTDLLVAQFYRTAIKDYFRGGDGGMGGLIGQFAPLAWSGVIPSQPYFPHDRSFTMEDEDGRIVKEGAQFLQMAPVGVNTITSWNPESGPDGSIRYGVTLYQQSSDAMTGRLPFRRERGGQSINIPASRMIQARYLPTGDDPAPYGLGRALWYGYKASESLNKFLLQGAEKAAFGIPQIIIGPEANPGERTTVNQLVANLRVGAIARFSLPDGYSVIWHEVPWSAKEILDALTLLQKSAHRATNTQHLWTGSDNGTQSLHGSQTKAFHTGVNVVCKAIVQALSHGPVDTAPLKMLGVLNFAGLRQFPTLRYGPPPVIDVKTWMDGVSSAVASGVLTPDGGVESSVRDVLQLAEMPPETLEMWRAKIENENAPNVSSGDSESALNGAQVRSAKEIAEGVAAGTLSRAAGREMLVSFFGVSAEVADIIVSGASAPDEPEPEPEPDPEPPKKAAPKSIDSDEGGEEADKMEAAAQPAPVAASDVSERSRFDRMMVGPRGRVVRAIEEVVALSETTGQTSLGKEVVSGILLRWRDRTAPVYGDLIEAEASTLGDVASIVVPNQDELIDELTEALRLSYRSGVSSVEQETERIESSPALRKRVESGMAPDVGEPGTVAVPERFSEHSHTLGCGVHSERLVDLSLAERMAISLAIGDVNDRLKKNGTKPVKAPTGPGPELEINPEQSIDSVARTTTAAEAARMKQTAMRALQAEGTGGALPGASIAVRRAVGAPVLTPGQAIGRSIGNIVASSIIALSDGVERNQAQADVNTIFGLGRNQQAVAQGSDRFVFSNLMESDTCDPCAEFDGQVFGLDQMDFFSTPFSQCLGGDMCGCLILSFPPDVEE